MTPAVRAEHDAVLRRCLESPFDDVPRSVYADWLEDHEQGPRARFVRAQLELAQVEAIPHNCGERGEWETTCAACGAHSVVEELRVEVEQLIAQEQVPPFWLRGLGLPATHLPDWSWDGRMSAATFWHHAGGVKIAHQRIDYTFARGLVSAIRLYDPRAALHQGGKGLCAIFARCPVTSVEVQGRAPSPTLLRGGNVPGFCWRRSRSWNGTGPNAIQRRTFDLLAGVGLHAEVRGTLIVYASAALAQIALAQALVSHGRSLVGLAPLPLPCGNLADL